MLTMITDLFVLLLIILVIATAAFIFVWIREYVRDRCAARRLVHPDGNGNYPVVLEGNYAFTFTSGNPPEVKMLVQNGVPQRLHLPERHTVINMPGAVRLTANDVEMLPVRQSPSRSNRSPEQIFEPESPSEPEPFHVQAVPDQLERAKRVGESKTQAIPRVTGIKRGGSSDYKKWSEFWDAIEI